MDQRDPRPPDDQPTDGEPGVDGIPLRRSLPPAAETWGEVEDDGPEPDLDPAVEAQVTALLASAPEVGPMPTEFADRIAAALIDEARLRVDPGPLTAAERQATVVPLAGRRASRQPWIAVGAVAAAAAVIAVGGSVLHVNKRPNGAAVVGDTAGAVSVTPTPGPTVGAVHIQLSETAYAAGSLASGARELLSTPRAEIDRLAAEAPSIGPIGTPTGLLSCLGALGVVRADAVSADLATYDGSPAAIVVVTRDSVSSAWAVSRTCSAGAAGVIKDATPVP